MIRDVVKDSRKYEIVTQFVQGSMLLLILLLKRERRDERSCVDENETRDENLEVVIVEGSYFSQNVTCHEEQC